MNKRENPYTPGAGRKPPILAGRDPDLENVQALVERLGGGGYERSLVYSAPGQLARGDPHPDRLRLAVTFLTLNASRGRLDDRECELAGLLERERAA
jgi:hypothetical protein